MCYSKRTTAPDGHTDTVIVVVNTDPHSVRESMVHLDMAALGMRPEDTFTVYDEISGATWRWGQQNYIRLDPNGEPVPHPRRPPRPGLTPVVTSEELRAIAHGLRT